MTDDRQGRLIQRVTGAVKNLAERITSGVRAIGARERGTGGVRTRISERLAWVRESRRRMIAVVGAVALIIAAVLVGGIALTNSPQALSALGVSGNRDALIVSGFIEAEEVNLASEVSGRVAALPLEEGDEVDAGADVVQLGSGTLEAQLEAARAQLDIMLAQQAILEGGSREEIVEQAEAGLMAAQAARDGAYDAWKDATTLRDNPQEINVQLAQAYTNFTVSQAQADAAQSRYDEAARVQWLYNNAPGAVDLYLGRGTNPNIAPNKRSAGDRAWQLQETRDAAQAALQGSQATLGAFYALRDDPQALEAQVISAEAQFHASEAQLMAAQARLDLVLAGATDEELAAAQANVDQAQAAVQRLERELAKLTIKTPTGGVVLDQTVLEGELAVPGVTLVTIADLDEVKLTVFVPEDQLDKVRIGQPVGVSVDSFPGRVFDGVVATIANEAEFTPRSVVTREERVSLVFAVEIRLPNPDHDLKPGMPADAALSVEG